MFLGALHELGNREAVHIWLEGLLQPYILVVLRNPITTMLTPPTSPTPFPAPSATIAVASTLSTPLADHDKSNSIPASAAPSNALMHLNQALQRDQAETKLAWDEINTSTLPGQSHAPQWRYMAIFLCKNGEKRVVGTATDARKKVAKNAAAHEAYHNLRKMGELQT